MAMICTPVGDAVVCREEMCEVLRKRDGEDRWCFHCRTIRRFDLVVTASGGDSYYGPTPGIECGCCAGCGVVHDRDVNAAKVIRAEGLSVLACGDGVRPPRS